MAAPVSEGPRAFSTAIEAEWPLAPGHCQRALFYNLYHLLKPRPTSFGGGTGQQRKHGLGAEQLIAARADNLRRLTWEGEVEGWPGLASHRLGGSSWRSARYSDAGSEAC